MLFLTGIVPGENIDGVSVPPEGTPISVTRPKYCTVISIVSAGAVLKVIILLPVPDNV